MLRSTIVGTYGKCMCFILKKTDSLITTDIQKNQLQHNVFGKECGGDLRGLVGNSRVSERDN